jgi:hypothetical protein
MSASTQSGGTSDAPVSNVMDEEIKRRTAWRKAVPGEAPKTWPGFSPL